MGADGADQLQPVLAQVGLAADEGDLADAEFGHLAHEIESFVGAQLIGARVACTRAAVAAGEVAPERDLPDSVNGTPCAVDGTGFVVKREIAPRGARDGSDRQGTGTCAEAHFETVAQCGPPMPGHKATSVP